MTNFITDASQLAQVCKTNQVEFLGVFGSAARGEEQSNSDIDVLVRFAPQAKIGYFKLHDIEKEITKSLGRKVDLVTQDALSPYVRDRVYSELKPLYGQP